MTAPTWFFDGDKRRIYEVPPSATYTVDGGGYRIYGQGLGTALMETDVKRDLWSRWVDWHATHDWALEAFSASGGNLRPTGEFAPADFSLQTAVGWRIVLANYPHETVFYGNLFAQGSDSLFDNARLGVLGVVPRMQGSANLLTYTGGGGGGGGMTSEQAQQLLELWRKEGLDPSKLVTHTPTSIKVGDPLAPDIEIALTGNRKTLTTMERQ